MSKAFYELGVVITSREARFLILDVKLLYPLSHAQKRIWYNELLFESSPLHNIGGCVGFQGNVNFEVLEEAINETIKSHPALRIRIQPGETEPKQYIKEYLYEKLDFICFCTRNLI